ncbi:cupin domain-containing protein [Humitalea sp. 24SJ18S-53]|uniref:cupin domain-containing protein n=1 Tax=Humitalea sp. 24SJ18S-53 TaxID=3422307 RepID=UPI003D677BEC
MSGQQNEPAPIGFTTTRLAAIDLAKEIAALDGRFVRLSHTAIRPGGGFDWHSHEGKPEIIYMLSGVLTEGRGDAVVEHTAGSVLQMTDGVRHSLANTGAEPAVYLSISVRKLT